MRSILAILGFTILFAPISGHADFKLKFYANQLFVIQTIFGGGVGYPVRLYSSGFMDVTEKADPSKFDQSDLKALLRVLSYENTDFAITRKVVGRAEKLLIAYPYPFDEIILKMMARVDTFKFTHEYEIIKQRNRPEEKEAFDKMLSESIKAHHDVANLIESISTFPEIGYMAIHLGCMDLLDRGRDYFKSNGLSSKDNDGK